MPLVPLWNSSSPRRTPLCLSVSYSPILLLAFSVRVCVKECVVKLCVCVGGGLPLCLSSCVWSSSRLLASLSRSCTLSLVPVQNWLALARPLAAATGAEQYATALTGRWTDPRPRPNPWALRSTCRWPAYVEALEQLVAMREQELFGDPADTFVPCLQPLTVSACWAAAAASAGNSDEVTEMRAQRVPVLHRAATGAAASQPATIPFHPPPAGPVLLRVRPPCHASARLAQLGSKLVCAVGQALEPMLWALHTAATAVGVPVAPAYTPRVANRGWRRAASPKAWPA
jgi:hypothetical protein